MKFRKLTFRLTACGNTNQYGGGLDQRCNGFMKVCIIPVTVWIMDEKTSSQESSDNRLVEGEAVSVVVSATVCAPRLTPDLQAE